MTDEELARDLVIKYIKSSCTRDELSALFDLLEKNSISLSEWDVESRLDGQLCREESFRLRHRLPSSSQGDIL